MKISDAILDEQFIDDWLFEEEEQTQDEEDADRCAIEHDSAEDPSSWEAVVEASDYTPPAEDTPAEDTPAEDTPAEDYSIHQGGVADINAMIVDGNTRFLTIAPFTVAGPYSARDYPMTTIGAGEIDSNHITVTIPIVGYSAEQIAEMQTPSTALYEHTQDYLATLTANFNSDPDAPRMQFQILLEDTPIALDYYGAGYWGHDTLDRQLANFLTVMNTQNVPTDLVLALFNPEMAEGGALNHYHGGSYGSQRTAFAMGPFSLEVTLGTNVVDQYNNQTGITTSLHEVYHSLYAMNGNAVHMSHGYDDVLDYNWLANVPNSEYVLGRVEEDGSITPQFPENTPQQVMDIFYTAWGGDGPAEIDYSWLDENIVCSNPESGEVFEVLTHSNDWSVMRDAFNNALFLEYAQNDPARYLGFTTPQQQMISWSLNQYNGAIPLELSLPQQPGQAEYALTLTNGDTLNIPSRWFPAAEDGVIFELDGNDLVIRPGGYDGQPLPPGGSASIRLINGAQPENRPDTYYFENANGWRWGGSGLSDSSPESLSQNFSNWAPQLNMFPGGMDSVSEYRTDISTHEATRVWVRHLPPADTEWNAELAEGSELYLPWDFTIQSVVEEGADTLLSFEHDDGSIGVLRLKGHTAANPTITFIGIDNFSTPLLRRETGEALGFDAAGMNAPILQDALHALSSNTGYFTITPENAQGEIELHMTEHATLNISVDVFPSLDSVGNEMAEGRQLLTVEVEGDDYVIRPVGQSDGEPFSIRLVDAVNVGYGPGGLLFNNGENASPYGWSQGLESINLNEVFLVRQMNQIVYGLQQFDELTYLDSYTPEIINRDENINESARVWILGTPAAGEEWSVTPGSGTELYLDANNILANVLVGGEFTPDGILVIEGNDIVLNLEQFNGGSIRFVNQAIDPQNIFQDITRIGMHQGTIATDVFIDLSSDDPLSSERLSNIQLVVGAMLTNDIYNEFHANLLNELNEELNPAVLEGALPFTEVASAADLPVPSGGNSQGEGRSQAPFSAA